MADTPSLRGPVGPNQTNNLDDLRLIRRHLNQFIQKGYISHLTPISGEGGWDASVANALQAVENKYFYGMADPNNKLENTDALFQFLVQIDHEDQSFASSLSGEVYMLASIMVPGGVDHVKRTVIKTTEKINGKDHIKKTVKEEKK